MAGWLWLIVAVLQSVMLVRDIMTGVPASEHAALLMLALVFLKLDTMDGGW